MDLKSLGQSVASSASTGALSVGGGAIANLISGAIARNNMNLQNKYNVEQWNREVSRQDYLLANQDLIKKNALRAAGYSTADPNGVGTTLSGINSPAGKGVSLGVGSGTTSPAALITPDQLAIARKANADAAGQEIINQRLGEQQGADISFKESQTLLNNSIASLNDVELYVKNNTKDEAIEQMLQRTKNMRAEESAMLANMELIDNKILNLQTLTEHERTKILETSSRIQKNIQEINESWSRITLNNKLGSLYKSQESLNEAVEAKTNSEKLAIDFSNAFSGEKWKSAITKRTFEVTDSDGKVTKMSGNQFELFVQAELTAQRNAIIQGNMAEYNAKTSRLDAIWQGVNGTLSSVTSFLKPFKVSLPSKSSTSTQ